METVKSYRDLRLWKQGIEIVKEVYGVSRGLPKEELFGLGDQLRRAAVSIPANIAEGQARQHRREYIQHLSVAKGSLAELDTLLIITRELGFVSGDELARLDAMIQDLRMPLQGLINSLRQNRV